MSKASKTAYLSLLGNFGLTVVKGTAGVLGNSHALVADAFESMADVFSSFFVLVGIKYSSKPADDNHPYGHGKIEPLVTFGVVGFLLIASTLIAYNSILNIQSDQEMPEKFTLIVLIGIIAFKEVMYRLVKKKAIETGSSALKAEAIHHRLDALTSLLAFIGIGVALTMGKGWETADDWAALLACVVIVFNAYRLFRPALAEIMDEHIYDDFAKQIRLSTNNIEGVIGAEKCMIRKHGAIFHVDLHVVVDGELSVHEGHQIAHQVKDTLRSEFPAIEDVIIHVEPNDSHHLSKLKEQGY